MGNYFVLANLTFVWSTLILSAYLRWRTHSARWEEVAIPILYATSILWVMIAILIHEAIYAKILPEIPENSDWITGVVAALGLIVGLLLHLRLGCAYLKMTHASKN